MGKLGFGDFIPIIGDAVDAFGSYLSNSKANETNMKIAQMNNEFSERMLEKQNQYNIDQWNREAEYNKEMWNKTNAYNSLYQQRKRAEAAGFSPLAVLGNNGQGSATFSSAPSGKGVGLPSPTSTTVQPTVHTSIGQSLARIMEYQLEKKRTDAEVRQIQIDNQTRLRENFARILKMEEDARSSKARRMLDEQLKEMRPQLWQSEMDLQRTQMDSNRMNALLHYTESLINLKTFKQMDQRFASDMAMSAAHTALLCAERKFTLQQTRKEIYNTISAQYQAATGKANYRLAERMTEDVIDNLKYQNKLLDRQYELMPYDKGGSILNGIFNTATQGIIGYGLLKGFKGPNPIKGFGR